MREYRVFGHIAGRIWMPAVECWKEFDTGWFTWANGYTYSPPKNGFSGEYPDLRTALLEVVNDGDFQSCSIVDAILEVRDTIGRKTITRSAVLLGRDGNRDLWMREEDRERMLCKIGDSACD